MTDRKRTFLSLFFFITALLLFGCTGKAPLSAATDAERLIGQVQPAEPVDIAIKPTCEPATPAIEYITMPFSDTFSAAEGRLTVTVDAEVRTPTAGTLPVAEVSAWFFDQTFSSRIFEHFFSDRQPTVDTDAPIVRSKDDLRAQITLYESYIKQGISEEQTLLTDEELREEIDRIKAQIPDAPDTAIHPETVYSDGTMLPAEIWNNDTPEETRELRVVDADLRLLIRTPIQPNESSTSYLSCSSRASSNPIFDNSFVLWTELPPDSGDARVPYPYADAVALCEDFLTAAGVTDAALHTAYLAETQGCYGYVFCYTRTVFGHPAALTSRNVRHSDNRWDYETLRFVVDSDGLQTVHWQSPTTLGNLVEANPAILSFSDAYAIFPPAITAAYAEKTERYGEDHLIALDVRRIDLAHVRIRDMGADGKAGYYVPAWVFYGTERDDGHYTMNGYTLVSDETVPKIRSEILLAINALDGSIIDFTKGY